MYYFYTKIFVLPYLRTVFTSLHLKVSKFVLSKTVMLKSSLFGKSKSLIYLEYLLCKKNLSDTVISSRFLTGALLSNVNCLLRSFVFQRSQSIEEDKATLFWSPTATRFLHTKYSPHSFSLYSVDMYRVGTSFLVHGDMAMMG